MGNGKAGTSRTAEMEDVEHKIPVLEAAVGKQVVRGMQWVLSAEELRLSGRGKRVVGEKQPKKPSITRKERLREALTKPLVKLERQKESRR
jgi:hypothetical protein